MRLYDALWALAAADLKTTLENKEFGHVLAATPQHEGAAASPEDAATAVTWQEWKITRAEKPSK